MQKNTLPMKPVAPILKIRAALRERCAANREAQEKREESVVESMTDELMLGWSEAEVTDRREARRLVGCVLAEVCQCQGQVEALLAAETPPAVLDRLLVFSKLESAAGLARMALDLLALCSLAVVLWVSLAPAGDGDALARAPRGRAVRSLALGVKSLARKEGFFA